jgi:sulfopyruvate decarboxylase subunit alpha
VSWQEQLADELADGGVEVAACVPDGRLAGVLVRLEQRGVTVRRLTREEECVAYAGGCTLAGGRAAVLMQCSGIGNALNAIGALSVPYGLGLALVVSMRGTLGERNPSQVPMGRATRPLLEALGVQAFSLREEKEIAPVVRGVLELAYAARTPAAAILEPELGGLGIGSY